MFSSPCTEDMNLILMSSDSQVISAITELLTSWSNLVSSVEVVCRSRSDYNMKTVESKRLRRFVDWNSLKKFIN